MDVLYHRHDSRPALERGFQGPGEHQPVATELDQVSGSGCLGQLTQRSERDRNRQRLAAALQESDPLADAFTGG